MQENRPAIFGEVLFDHFPDGARVLGGAPFNVAWHLQAFKQSPCFISRIGADKTGCGVIEVMDDWGMDKSHLQLDPEYPTGKVQIELQSGEPEYEILIDQAYDFIEPGDFVNEVFSVLYHGSLAIRHQVSFDTLEQFKAKHVGKIFVDINLRSPWWDKHQVVKLINQADWVKLNEDEFFELSKCQSVNYQTMQHFLIDHKLDVLLVTCGENGAKAISADAEFYEVQPDFDLTVVDTVGAGDGFSAVMLLAIQLDWPLKQALIKAQKFASALVTCRGGTVTDPGFYQFFIKDWNLG